MSSINTKKHKHAHARARAHAHARMHAHNPVCVPNILLSHTLIRNHTSTLLVTMSHSP